LDFLNYKNFCYIRKTSLIGCYTSYILNKDTAHDKKYKRYNEAKRVSYRDAFRSLLKGSSSGRKRKRTQRKRKHTWYLWTW